MAWFIKIFYIKDLEKTNKKRMNLPKCKYEKELKRMHYYAIKPFFIPDGHSIDLSLGEEAVSNIIESAYWNLQSDARVYDHIYRANHDDLLVFDSLNEFEKSAGVLNTFEIKFETSHILTSLDYNAFQTFFHKPSACSYEKGYPYKL